MLARLAACVLLPTIWINEANAQALRVVQDPWYNEQPFYASYMEKYGFSPQFRSMSDEEELVDFLISGADFDVARICSSSLNALVSANVLQPWDTTRIRDFDKIDHRFLFPDAQNNLYMIPFEFGSDILVYDPENVPKSDAESLTIFQNLAYQGHLSIEDDLGSIAAISFLATGVTDWSNVTDAQIEAALQWWREIGPNIHYYWDDEDVLAHDITNGIIGLAFATDEIADLIKDYDKSAGSTIVAREGGSLWSCGLVRSAKSKAPEDQIYDYVNAYFEEPAVRRLLEWDTASTNFSATAKLLGEEGPDALGLPENDAKVLIQSPLPLNVRKKFIEERRRQSVMP